MQSGRAFEIGRRWLGLTQDELADAVRLTRATIVTLEKNPNLASTDTRHRILDYFIRRGISVSEDGLKVLNEPIRIISGPDWYHEVLEDVLWSGAQELRVEFADDRVSTANVITMLRDLRQKGLTFYIMTDDSHSYIGGKLVEYRLIPSQHFSNIVTATYADNVIIGRSDRQSCIRIKDADLAAVTRARFDLLFKFLPQPTHTSAPADAQF